MKANAVVRARIDATTKEEVENGSPVMAATRTATAEFCIAMRIE